ncbi:oxamate carbamoyltransferase subunit AllG family protein [Cellulosimicrobium marinum]|uniref:oxamate carbamoyltransferase subunit AllG family protein n=1 Tax=Cellulosimicrobium marinum TaxID=1638992 RepID=UPI001E38AC02|nr:DUF1116 domain-containing protein [Cellulosimicrobium marinum]MCB7135706.1 DUF1116 domain-containing protein [Cellulosimicrobium marinum]
MHGEPTTSDWRGWDRHQVWLRRAGRAGDHDDQVGRLRYLAAGPPVRASQASEPVKAALTAALLLEGEASSRHAAEQLIRSDTVELVPGYASRTVVPLSSVVSPSMPVLILEDTDGRVALGPVDRPGDRVLRHGCDDPAVVAGLRHTAEVIVPLLDRALQVSPFNVTRALTESLRRGDDGHARTVAGSSLLTSHVLAALLADGRTGPDAVRVTRWLQLQPHLFGGATGPAARLLVESSVSPEFPTMLTAIGANGREIGIRTVGGGDRWFVAPAPVGRVVLGPRVNPAEAHPVLGDSFVVEAAGLGAQALHASPCTTDALGLTPSDVETFTRGPRVSARRTSTRFRVPGRGGLPTGIDVAQLAQAGERIAILTGVVSRTRGIGLVGAGIAVVPSEVLREAAAGSGTPLAPGVRAVDHAVGRV